MEEGRDNAPDEVSPDEPPGDTLPGGTETAVAETGDSPLSGAPDFPDEPAPEPPVFDEPVVEAPEEFPPDLPFEAPADSFGGDSWSDAGSVDTEPETDGGGDYAGGVVDYADADAGSADTADTSAIDITTAGTDAAGTDVMDTGAADTDTAGADTAGADANGADATDTAGAGDTGAESADANAPDTAPADAADAPAVLPAEPPADVPKPPIPADETVIVKQLDQYLPAFRIVEELDIGRYNLVFQVMGEKEILYRTYKPIYFIRDAKFTLGEIQSFLPMEITGGRLIPPGINVMLTTEINADPRLDPYIIWHNGKKILAQGRLSGGANYLLWKTPEQTGFHSIRAEVFPLLPGDRIPGNMIGKIKELSLPVSSRSEGIRHFNDPSGEFISWYQFWGTLDDTKAPNNPERRLVSLYAQSPRWAPFGGIYGLLVGRDDIYTLPGAPVKVSADEQGTGRLLFHLAALSEGSIVNIRFAGGEIAGGATETAESPAGTAELDLSFAGDALILRIASNDLAREESLALNDDAANGFITVIVEFAIAPDRFDAELRLENPPETTGLLSIALAAPISGEGSVRFGDYSGPRQGAKRPASGSAGKYGNGTMVLNELALSYSRVPVPPQEEEFESGAPETLLAEEEDPGAEPEQPSPNAL
jgi:hypothetical protein